MKLLPIAMLALAACATTDTMDGYAPDAVYHNDIVACASGTCAPLCVKVFAIDPEDLESCRILAIDPGGARVRAEVAAGGFLDWIDVDSSDDGSSDDTDTPPDDDDGTPPDDGTDTGSGSDDGSTT